MAGLDWMIHGSRIPDLADGAKFGRLSLPGYTHTYIGILIINMCICIYIYICKAEISESFSPYRIPSKTPSAETVADVLTKKGLCECHLRMGVILFSPKKKGKPPVEGLARPKMLRELVNAQMH